MNLSCCGLTPDQVVFNWMGGANGTGRPTLSINDSGDAALPNNNITGIFLNPNGTISINSTRMTLGRVFGGDTADLNFQSSTFISSPVPEPSSIVLAGFSMLLFGSRSPWKRSKVEIK